MDYRSVKFPEVITVRKFKAALFAIPLLSVYLSSAPSVAISEPKENVGVSVPEKFSSSAWNKDPGMLLPGNPDIDPGMLLPGNPDIDPGILIKP
jgi:hypothetical protein